MPEVLNLQSLLYVGFRLGPFILVSFFVLSALFNSDLKGLIFLSMLLFNCFITIMVGNMLPEDTLNKNPYGVCEGLSLTRDGPLSRNLPLNINIFAFTFAYLAQIIQVYDLIKSNIPTVIVFSLLILFQWYWSYANECNSLIYSFFSLALGFGFGWLFSFCIDQMGFVQLQYFNGISNQEVCSRPSTSHFKCTMNNKTGALNTNTPTGLG